MIFLFWISLFLLFYAYLGYSLLILLLGRCRTLPHFPATPADAQPRLSIILVVHNEEAQIHARLENLLQTEYPEAQLEIIVVSDGSTDNTEAIVDHFPAPQVTLLKQDKQCGKAAGLNLAVPQAQGEILVLTDVRQRFEPQTIPKLVQPFQDPKIGAVSGALHIAGAESTIGSGIGCYWNLERLVREAEGRWDSCIGCSGAIYAVRRALFQALPPDTILDDVVIPMQVALAGSRVLFQPTACAFDPQTLEPEKERRRKTRTLAGNFQLIFRYPQWLLPWKNRLWWQLLSHKYLRLTGPFLLVILALTAFLLRTLWLPRLVLCGLGLLVILGLLGSMGKNRTKSRLLSLPAGFLFLNIQILRAIAYYRRGDYRQGWR